MLTTALKPKWLGLLALVVAVMIGFALLGRWQLDVAREKGVADATAEAARRPVTPLNQVMRPDGTFPEGGLDRRVSLTGRYVAEHQVLVVDRRLGDARGYWVVTPLAVEGSTGRSGGAATIPVLRGFVTDPAAVPAPPAGPVSVTGTLAQSEPPPNQFQPLPDGRVATINVPALLNRWGGDMFNAFVFLGEQQPPSPASLTVVAPPRSGVTGLNWRNLAYALQWWCFALFALYMWWRMVREDDRARRLVSAAPVADPRAPSATPSAASGITPSAAPASPVPPGEPRP